MSQAHVQVVLADATLPPMLESALKRVQASTSFVRLADALERGVSPACDAVVVVSQNAPAQPGGQVDSLLRTLRAGPRGTLLICSGPRPAAPGLDGPQLSVSDGRSPEELAARIESLIRFRAALRARRQAPPAVGAAAYPPHLRVASRIRRRLLPPRLPRLPATRLHAVQRHVEDASGDVYDIQRMGADSFGIHLADAGRRGLPTPLLTVFVKRAVHAGDGLSMDADTAPAAVLQRLNHELVRSGMCGGAPVAVTYLLLNSVTNRIVLARGGAPYPLLRRADGRVELVQADGPLLGLKDAGTFTTAVVELKPGDALLLCSDGVDDLGSGGRGAIGAAAGATALMERLAQGLDAAMEHAANRHDVLRRVGQAVDDLTLLGIEAAQPATRFT